MARKKTMSAAPRLFAALLFHGVGGTTFPPDRSTVIIHMRTPPSGGLSKSAVLVVDVDGGLLMSCSLFSYFMLVAVEAGSFLRGLLLLLMYPVIACVSRDVGVRIMALVAFCGLREARFLAGRAVLPRWFLADVGQEGFEVVRQRQTATVVWTSRMPRVMVEPFLKEYMQVVDAVTDVVAAREMKVVWGFYTGIMEEGGASTPLKMEGNVVGFTAGSSMEEFVRGSGPLLLMSICKEVYVVSGVEKRKWRPLPRGEYPRPLVFHDGRLVFRPTPLATAAMLTWLPFGAALSVIRLIISIVLPYRYSTVVLAATGQSWRIRGGTARKTAEAGRRRRGQLYVCNHRTLIDPVYVSVALDRPVRAVSYSLSRVSDLLSPIGPTVRLARNRARDGAAMASLLDGGAHVVVCPEGTTCREPYLLRFSPLFAELSDDVVPVAVGVETAMFDCTTASGWKALDPLTYLANPRMCYTVEFLGSVDTTPVKDGAVASTDVANVVQRRMADALGYECTMLTRKDKYRVLAGNDGVVRRNAEVSPTCHS